MSHTKHLGYTELPTQPWEARIEGNSEGGFIIHLCSAGGGCLICGEAIEGDTPTVIVLQPRFAKTKVVIHFCGPDCGDKYEAENPKKPPIVEVLYKALDSIARYAIEQSKPESRLQQ